METAKPRAKPGATCPLWRKDVSKVCHDCELYEHLPMQRSVGGRLERVDHWGCTLKHQTVVLRDLGLALEAVAAATESFRNDAWKTADQNLRDMADIAKHQTSYNTGVMHEMVEALRELARQGFGAALTHGAGPAKLVNGGSGRSAGPEEH